MFIGHFGLAYSAKKPAPQVSLGTFFLAAQWADLLWPIFLIFNIEHVAIHPGDTIVTPLNFESYPYSHSLVFDLGWAVIFGTVYFLIKKNFKNAVVLALLVLSHWVLDFVVHRPDMPLLPSGPYFGLGLWNNLPVTIVLEYFVFVSGIFLYLKATEAKDKTGKYALWSLIIFLGVMYPVAVFGPPPLDVNTIKYSALTIWILVPWAYWIDRHRKLKINQLNT